MKLTGHFENMEEYYSPKIIGEVNDMYVKVAIAKGNDIPWHNHKDEDELFYIVEGSLLFEIEDKKPFTMNKGDLYIVKKGINHRISATEELLISVILFERFCSFTFCSNLLDRFGIYINGNNVTIKFFCQS